MFDVMLLGNVTSIIGTISFQLAANGMVIIYCFLSRQLNGGEPRTTFELLDGLPKGDLEYHEMLVELRGAPLSPHSSWAGMVYLPSSFRIFVFWFFICKITKIVNQWMIIHLDI